MNDRAQLVLVAAGVVAVALVPLTFAYLQLGSHPDVDASEDPTSPVRDGIAVLERAVYEAGSDATGAPWSEREGVVSSLRQSLEPRFRSLESSRVGEGIAYQVSSNRSAAADWAGSNCPSGPSRRFGACTAIDGVVVQERAGETTVLAVAVDLRVTTSEGESAVTVVVQVVG
ncbi:DUF7261 family protein [Haloarchaeobius sp. HRN-SO-5]|uniref:DUF7261 family protein n=1 Tax=Haloarchaeobius sp. HRN-SO-5 TaxID=3446118 RepID=UPI003EC14D21